MLRFASTRLLSGSRTVAEASEPTVHTMGGFCSCSVPHVEATPSRSRERDSLVRSVILPLRKSHASVAPAKMIAIEMIRLSKISPDKYFVLQSIGRKQAL